MSTDTDELLSGLKVTFEEGVWRKDAACKDLNVNLFFPEKAQLVPQEVKDTCASCPVQEKCLDYAIRANIVIGFWGGKNVRQRRVLRREWLKANNIVAVHGANKNRNRE